MILITTLISLEAILVLNARWVSVYNKDGHSKDIRIPTKGVHTPGMAHSMPCVQSGQLLIVVDWEQCFSELFALSHWIICSRWLEGLCFPVCLAASQ